MSIDPHPEPVRGWRASIRWDGSVVGRHRRLLRTRRIETGTRKSSRTGREPRASGQLIQVSAAGKHRERHVCSSLRNVRLKRQLQRALGGGEGSRVPAVRAPVSGGARSAGMAPSGFG
jgi:hypothetical protein